MMRFHQIGRVADVVLVILVSLAFAGCASYEMQGRIVPGSSSQVLVVEADDPRLDDPGLADVSVRLLIDPDKPGRRVASAVSNPEGWFAIPVDEIGAGVLDYQARVIARQHNLAPADATFALPGGGKRVLIIMAPGQDTAPSDAKDFVEETLRLGDPYMR